MRRHDLTGKRFGKLIVIGPYKNRRWQCKCDCGNITWVFASNLTRNNTTSCGCIHREAFSVKGRQKLAELRAKGVTWKKHGKVGSQAYNAWRAMKDRCLCPTNSRYKDYGGRGITIYPPWIKDFRSYDAYLGEPPSPYHSVDRIDNNGNYEPGNIRWANPYEQTHNRRGKPKFIVEGLTLSELSAKYHVPRTKLRQYLVVQHLSLEEALKQYNHSRWTRID